MIRNRHIQPIPSTVMTQAQTKIDEARELLAPYLLALTPAERHELPKMGEKTIGFVEKAYDFALKNPDLVQSHLNMGDFGADFSDAHGLWTLLNSIQQLEQGVNDTELAAGSEAYQSALAFYKYIKMLAEQDIQGAKAIYDALKSRFPGGKRKSGKTEE